MAISLFDLSWKSKVKVMGKVKIQGQKECPTSYRLTSILYHINQLSHSWATSISKFENQGQGHSSRPHSGPNIHSHLSFHVNRSFHSWDIAFLKFVLENPRSKSWVRSNFNTLSTFIPFVPCQSALPFLRYGDLNFDLQNPRSMDEWGQNSRSHNRFNI